MVGKVILCSTVFHLCIIFPLKNLLPSFSLSLPFLSLGVARGAGCETIAFHSGQRETLHPSRVQGKPCILSRSCLRQGLLSTYCCNLLDRPSPISVESLRFLREKPDREVRQTAPDKWMLEGAREYSLRSPKARFRMLTNPENQRQEVFLCVLRIILYSRVCTAIFFNPLSHLPSPVAFFR